MAPFLNIFSIVCNLNPWSSYYSLIRVISSVNGFKILNLSFFSIPTTSKLCFLPLYNRLFYPRNLWIRLLNKSSNNGLIKYYCLKIIFRILWRGLVQRYYSFLINNLWKSHPVLNENFDEEPLKIQLYGNKQSLQTMSFQLNTNQNRKQG